MAPGIPATTQPSTAAKAAQVEVNAHTKLLFKYHGTPHCGHLIKTPSRQRTFAIRSATA
jgi:hypothetical protein